MALLAVVVWLLLCGFWLRRASVAAGDGLDSARQAKALGTPADVLSGRTGDALARAAEEFDQARRALRNPLTAPLRVLPVLGRQLRSSGALVTAAADVSRIGAEAVAEARQAFDAPHGSGPERVALLRRLAGAAGRAGDRLGDIGLGPDRALVGTLADKRQELADNIDDVRRALGTARSVTTALAGLLEGPSRYLVLAANNSEMRAGSGMFLSIGEARLAQGSVSLAAFDPAGDRQLAPGTEPPIPDPDLARHWAWLGPNREWRNLATTPRFDATAALAVEMWAASGRDRPDGVLALDPLALQAILAATGPVDIGERTVSAEEVAGLLLHDQYAGIDDVADRAQAERREMLGAIAGAAVAAVQGPDVDLTELAEGLAEAARGRHLLAWSAVPSQAEGWEAAGVDGRLDDESLMLAVLNRAGNKLDRFLAVDATLARTTVREGTEFDLAVRLANQVPDGEPAYVIGPHPDATVGAGVYFGLLSVNLPGAARRVEVVGNPDLTVLGRDGPTVVAALPVTVEPGGTIEVRFRFTIPGPGGQFRIEPTARVPAVRWTGPDGSWSDGEAHTVRW